MRALNAKERKALVKQVREQYGCEGIPDFIYFEGGEGKLFAATRDIEAFLGDALRIERVGVYVGQLRHGELRLSIEGSQLFGPAATRRVLDLTAGQRDAWMLGKDVPVDEALEQAFYIVRSGEDYLGCGKVKAGTLINFVPKERYVGATFSED